MRVLPRLSFCVLVLGLACNKGQSSPLVETIDPAARTGMASAQHEGPHALPAAVPSTASAVFSVRLPSPMFAAMLDADPMSFPAGSPPELRKHLDTLLTKAVGIRLLDATTITGFVLGDRDFALLLAGVDSRIDFRRVGEHGGVPVFGEKDSRIRLAQLGSVLVVGTERATKAAIDASWDERVSAKNGELARLVRETTQGATMVIATDLGALHPYLKRGLPAVAKVDRGLLIFGSEGVTLHAEGATDKIEGLAMALNSLRNATATEGTAMSDDAFLASVIDGNTLRLEFPMNAEDSPRLIATALPAVAKYMRRARASEAPEDLGRMADAASSYFTGGHVTSKGAPAAAAHSCPNDGTLAGESGITPPLALDCSKGPEGRCMPASDDAPLTGYYPLSVWGRDVWNGLNFQQEQGHFFHYNFIWKNAPSGFGACQFTAQAFGDLDGDGVFSTYERYGALDEDGVKHAAELYIDHELE